MKIRTHLLATAVASIALLAGAAFAGTASGTVVSVSDDTITVMEKGKTTIYHVPTDVKIESSDARAIERAQLRGQTVTLTVADPKPNTANERQEIGQPVAQPHVTNIRIVDVESDVDAEESE